MTDIEQRLVNAARAGEWLECAKKDAPVPADLIRDLLLGRHGDLDPVGVRLDSARIRGVLDLDRVKAAVGLAFVDCTIEEPIEARYATLPDLLFSGGRCAGIYADGLQIDGDLFLRDGVRVERDDERGAIKLIGGQVGGDAEFSDVRITNAAGPALNADKLTVRGQMLVQGARFAGHGERPAVSLNGARLASNLVVTSTEISNDTGPALGIWAADIGGPIRLEDGVRLTSGGAAGALLLVGTHVSGRVTLAGTDITSAGGPGLDATDVEVGGSFLIADTKISNGAGAAVTLDHAHVGGGISLTGGTRLSAGGDSGAVSLSNVRAGDWFLCEESIELAARSESLNLRHMVAGAVRLPHSSLCPDKRRGSTCDHTGRVRLDDFSYSSLSPTWHWEEWLHVIRCHTPAYHASAYQRLAAVERAAGHDGTVRQILMAQQTDLRRRSPESLGGPLTRWFHWLWGVLAGYGYRARRTAAALMLVLVAAGALGWVAGQVSTRPGHLVAERVATAPVGAGTPCSTVELVGLGLDRGLPLAMTGMRARCDLDTASRKGQAFTAAIWVVQLAVWGLATLALAGYTNLVRKPG
ncbi:hypothetical protein ACFWNN_33920 [Lentzea sp. NPDC058450]|uniref:hypothetical protein n=1 Tax=Lentzea sp. NPDC058450 TaxID=3346505 RepID=UPI003654DCFF